MRGPLSNLRYYGTSLSHPKWLNRNIVVANSISSICTLAVLLLAVVHAVTHREDNVVYFGLLLAVWFISIPFLHRAGHINFGRTFLTIALITGTLLFTMVRKMTTIGELPMNTFFQSRTAIVVFCIIPLATFNFSERNLLIINLLIGFLSLMLYDPIHNLFGIGFYQLGFNDPDYYYTNVIFFVIFTVLTSAAGFFKFEMETYEKRNEELIETLHSRNNLIEEQKEELNSQGEILKQLLQQRDKDLSQVTHQLINFNHELLEYSYTVSHNLRGPVARILGLLGLYKDHSDEKERKNLVGYMQDSAHELDAITLELNKIVEARSDTFNVRENVSFETELEIIKKLLDLTIKNYNVKITSEFNVPVIFSAKPRINHLMFILVSNAIQYRRPDRPPKIKISTYRKDDRVVLEVQDNGRGIDLSIYRKDLFKPFKRFHSEASGKGIGLYLAKLQAEKLEGRIEVRSSPGDGAIFSVLLKDWQGNE